MQKSVGFDLDGIFVNRPPFVPKFLIEWLYKDQRSRKKLFYRIPSPFEQRIRRLSHLPFVRPPLVSNCNLIRKLARKGNYKFYLISGRFGFLEDLTFAWLKKHRITTVFKKIYLNTSSIQPHQFKEKILKKLSIPLYIDDDLDSLEYLSSRLPKTKFYWYIKENSLKIKNKNIEVVSDLNKVLK